MKLSLATAVTIQLSVFLLSSCVKQDGHKVKFREEVKLKEVVKHKVQTPIPNEFIEEVDEDNPRCCDKTTAIVVPDTLVEVFEEDGPKRQASFLTLTDKDRDEPPLKVVKAQRYLYPKKEPKMFIPNIYRTFNAAYGERQGLSKLTKLSNITKTAADVPSFGETEYSIQSEAKAHRGMTNVTSKQSEHPGSRSPWKRKRPHMISPTVNKMKYLHQQSTTSIGIKPKYQLQLSSEAKRQSNQTERVRTAKLHLTKIRPQSRFSNSSINRGNTVHRKNKFLRCKNDSSTIVSNDNFDRKSEPLTVDNSSRCTYVVIKQREGCKVLSNSTTTKHLLDLINFFKSFCKYEPTSPNKNDTNGDKKGCNSTHIEERGILGNLKNIVDFIHLTRSNIDVNHTRKACSASQNSHNFTNNSSISLLKSNRTILKESIYRGWTKASKKKGDRMPAKKNTLPSNYTKASIDQKIRGKGEETDFEMRIIELMQKVNRTELEKLENHIVGVLESHQHDNFSKLQSRYQQKHNDTYWDKKQHRYQSTSNLSSKILIPQTTEVSSNSPLKKNALPWKYKNESTLINQLNKSGEGTFSKRLPKLMTNLGGGGLQNVENHIVNFLGPTGNRNLSHLQQMNQQENIIHRGEQLNSHQRDSYWNMTDAMISSKNEQEDQTKKHAHSENNNTKLEELPVVEPKATPQKLKGKPKQGNKTQLRHKQFQVNVKKLKVDNSQKVSNLFRTAKTKTSHRSHQKDLSPFSSKVRDEIKDFFYDLVSASPQNSRTLKGINSKGNADISLQSSSNQSTFHMTPSTDLRGVFSTKNASNITSIKAIYQLTKNVNVASNKSREKGKHVSNITNVFNQHEYDVHQERFAKTKSVSQKLSSGVTEMTQFVDQALEKEIWIIKWSHWLPCSRSCGSDAKRKRIQYRCTSHLQEARNCTVSSEQQEHCKYKPCPVHGSFTSWSHWSSCSRSCGLQGVSARTRTCNPPHHGGRPCFGERIKTRPCNRKHCPVNGGLSQWSMFGPCSKSCGGGLRMRRRFCNNPVPQYGGRECDQSNIMEIQSCGNTRCSAKILKEPQVVNVNPKLVCDFDPCKEAGCLYNPEARCITDFECNPVFFNTDGKMLPQCRGLKSLYSRIPNVICSFNPCLSSKCWDLRYQCVVDLECRPIFIGIDKRSIPLDCQEYQGTVRVDRIKEYHSWSTKVAVSSIPSFTQISFPPPPQPQAAQTALRFPQAYKPLGVSKYFSSNGIRDEQGITEVEIEKPRKAIAYNRDDFSAAFGTDDDDDDEDGDNDDEDYNEDDDNNEDDDDYDLGVGYVYEDIDDND